MGNDERWTARKLIDTSVPLAGGGFAGQGGGLPMWDAVLPNGDLALGVHPVGLSKDDGAAGVGEAEATLVEESLEGLDGLRRELPARAALDLREGLERVARGAVHADAGHRVPRVRDGEDAGAGGDLVPVQPVGIAAPVPVLMVAADPGDLLAGQDVGDWSSIGYGRRGR